MEKEGKGEWQIQIDRKRIAQTNVVQVNKATLLFHVSILVSPKTKPKTKKREKEKTKKKDREKASKRGREKDRQRKRQTKRQRRE